MASFNISSSASGYSYFGANPDSQYNESTVIRIGKHNIGGLKFDRSLNSIFNTSASSISSLGIKSAQLRVYIQQSDQEILHIAISNSEIDEDFTKIYSQISVEPVTPTSRPGDGFPVGINTFNITSLFTTTNGNSTYLTPNDSTWYLYFHYKLDTGLFTMMRPCREFDYRIYFQTYEGTIQYYNGSSWEMVTPYYCNGIDWVPCTVQYCNGTDWIQC